MTDLNYEKREETAMNRNVYKLLAAALCLCLALSGCVFSTYKLSPDKLDALKDRVNRTDPADPTDAPVEVTDAPADYDKYNTYIALADEMAEMEEILEVYFNNVLYQEEFALAEGGDYAAIKEAVQFYTGLSYTLEKALDYAAEEPFYAEADAAVQALGDSPAKVMDALDHLGSYMRFDDFADDNMARAPELHAELWAALETYDRYYPVFLNALSDLAEQGEDEEMSRLREAGELIRYNARLMVRAAENIQDEIWTQLEEAAKTADPDAEPELPSIDMTDLSPLFEKFQTAYNDLTAALDSEEQREKISAFTGKFGEESLQIYTNRADSLFTKVGSLAQALLEGSDYSDAYDNVGEAITEMINTYNNTNS